MMTSRSEELVVPPFKSRGRLVTKYTSPTQFAETVRNKWKAAGYEVNVWVEWQQSIDEHFEQGWVRSDLIAGLPRHVWLERYTHYLAAGGRPVAMKRAAQPDGV
jgi:hypothetical protein